METTTEEVFYRYEDLSGHIVCRHFKVLKHTPKGVWLDMLAGTKRFVKTVDVKKQFACATFDEAKASFKARKKRQLKIYEAKIQHIKRALHDIDMFSSESGTFLNW